MGSGWCWLALGWTRLMLGEASAASQPLPEPCFGLLGESSIAKALGGALAGIGLDLRGLDRKGASCHLNQRFLVMRSKCLISNDPGRSSSYRQCRQ